MDNATPSVTSESPSHLSGTTEKASELSGWSPRADNRTHGSQLSRQTLGTISNDSETPIKSGWPLLAQWMSEKPELESFCRFRSLQVKNLLYYQVELAKLEADLRHREKVDGDMKTSGEWAATYATWAHRMIASKDDEKLSQEEREQSKLVLKIRQLLREYNEAILQHAEISALPQPDACSVETLRVRMKRAMSPNLAIQGKAASAWGEIAGKEKPPELSWSQTLLVFGKLLWPWKAPPEDLNLVRTQHHQELDALTSWVKQEFIPLWHNIRSQEEIKSVEDPDYEKMDSYSDLTMLKFTSFVATVIACLLPTIAIGIMTTAKTTRDKLLYIGGFTILFAIGLLWVAEAGTSRIQIFMATAAFSAVMVVFIQNQ